MPENTVPYCKKKKIYPRTLVKNIWLQSATALNLVCDKHIFTLLALEVCWNEVAGKAVRPVRLNEAWYQHTFSVRGKKRGNILLLMSRFNSEVYDTGFTKVNKNTFWKTASALLSKAEGFHAPSSWEKKLLTVWKSIWGLSVTWAFAVTDDEKCAAVGQRKDKYLGDKDETGQQVLDKASTWTNYLRHYHYDQKSDATTVPNTARASYIAKINYTAVETDFSSSLLMIWVSLHMLVATTYKWNPRNTEGLEWYKRVFLINCTR